MKSNKILDYTFFTFILTLSGGAALFPLNFGFISMYAFRLMLVVLLLILTIQKKLIVLPKHNSVKYLLIILVVWIGYASTSLAWAPYKSGVFQEIFYLLVGLFTIIAMYSYSFHSRAWRKNLTYGWILGLIINIAFALYEINKGAHIDGSYFKKLTTLVDNHPANYVAYTFFDNPNNLSIYLIFSIPILFFLFVKGKSTFFFILTGIISYILLINGSLFSYFALLVMGILIFSWHLLLNRNTIFQKNKLKIPLIIGSATFIYAIGVFQFNDIKTTIKAPKTVITETQEIQDLKNSLQPSGNITRKNLLRNGVYFLKESNYLGIGGGNFKYYHEQGLNKYQVITAKSPHCWVMEILAQYGILIFTICMLWFLFMGYEIIKDLLKNFKNPYLLVSLLLFCSYFIMSNANSTFMGLPHNWVILALIPIYHIEGSKKID